MGLSDLPPRTRLRHLRLRHSISIQISDIPEAEHEVGKDQHVAHFREHLWPLSVKQVQPFWQGVSK